MIAFFRLFAAFRALEASLRATEESRYALQGEVMELRRSNQALRDENEEARKHERNAYQMLVNVDYQLKYGFAPYPDAPKLPERMQDATSGAIDDGMPLNAVLEAQYAASREEFEKFIS